jgi:outer membrane lipoprotein-sorting protein
MTPAPPPTITTTLNTTALPIALPTLEPVTQTEPITLQSSPEAIRQRLLYSHLFWKTVWVDAQAEPALGFPDFHEQVWLEPPNKGRVLSGSGDEPNYLWVSDGESELLFSPDKNILPSGSQKRLLSPSWTFPLILPPDSDTIYRHPLGEAAGPLGSLLFPTVYAQRKTVTTFKVVREDIAAGRKALVIDWTDHSVSPHEEVLLWVDVETGIVLRSQSVDAATGNVLPDGYEITAIRYNETFPPEIFILDIPQPLHFIDVGP